MLPDYHPAYHFYGFPDLITEIDSPYIEYCLSDKSGYRPASELFIDEDNDWLLNSRGHVAMNINFVFVNVHLFQEVATHFDTFGRYCDYDKHLIQYKQFWGRETYRRKHGLTRNCKLLFTDIEEYVDPNTSPERKAELLQPLHITGDHYTYLNYSRIERTLTDAEILDLESKGDSNTFKKTKQGFPFFIDGDYWDYKLDDFSIKNNKDETKAKARRKGYSYKEGSRGANRANLYKSAKLLYLAYDIDFLTAKDAITSMLKKNLDWFETKTHWKRTILSKVLSEITLGYKSEDGKMDEGWGSIIFSEGCQRNTSAAVGKQAIKTVYEECGKFENLLEVIDLTKSVNEVGEIKVGTSTYFGTGGSKEGDYLAFKYIFRNPAAFDCIELMNVWDKGFTDKACGFFYPQILGLLPYIEDGNSQLVTAYISDYKNKELKRQQLTLEKYIAYVGQRANTPVEAFISNIENIFSSNELNEHIHQVEHNDDYRFFRDGWYETDTHPKDKEVVITFKDSKDYKNKKWEFIEDVPFDPKKDVHGLVREYFPPIRVNGVVVKDRYLVTYDPVKIDKDVSTITRKHSLAAIQVWDRVSGALVAEWIGRLNIMDDMDLIALTFCRYWNASLLPEVNVGEVIKNFRLWGTSHLIERDPVSYILHGKKDPKAPLGVSIPNGASGFKYYEYFRDLMYEKIGMNNKGETIYRFQNCYSLPVLKSMQIFSLDINLDALAAARLGGLYFKSVGCFKPTSDHKKERKERMADTLKMLSQCRT